MTTHDFYLSNSNGGAIKFADLPLLAVFEVDTMPLCIKTSNRNFVVLDPGADHKRTRVRAHKDLEVYPVSAFLHIDLNAPDPAEQPLPNKETPSDATHEYKAKHDALKEALDKAHKRYLKIDKKRNSVRAEKRLLAYNNYIAACGAYHTFLNL